MTRLSMMRLQRLLLVFLTFFAYCLMFVVSLSSPIRKRQPHIIVENECCTLYDIRSLAHGLESVEQKQGSALYTLSRKRSNGVLTAMPLAESNIKEAMISNHEACFLLRVRDPPPHISKSLTVVAANKDDVPIGTTLLYCDDRVNIWEFLLQPGESCPFHVHRHVYMFINLAVSLTLALGKNGQPTEENPRMQQQDQITFVSRENLGAHGVRNVGKDAFQQFIVEFKQW